MFLIFESSSMCGNVEGMMYSIVLCVMYLWTGRMQTVIIVIVAAIIIVIIIAIIIIINLFLLHFCIATCIISPNITSLSVSYQYSIMNIIMMIADFIGVLQ